MRSELRAALVSVAVGSLLSLGATTGALADTVTAGPDATQVPGASGSFVVGLVVDDNSTDPVNGCDATGNEPVTLHFSSSAPAVVAAPADARIYGCDTVGTAAVENGVTIGYTVASDAIPGESAAITVTASGGRLSPQGKPKVYGTFSPDSMTVTVGAPAPTDTTPPVVVPTVSGTQGLNGWYTGDVAVTWNVSDADGPITSSTGCGSTTITQDTTGSTLTCTATSAGGSTSQSVTIKRDATAPTITCGQADSVWHGDNVSIGCVASDATSGLSDPADGSFSLSTDVASGTETSNAATGTRTVFDAAGNSAEAGPVTGNMVDRKAPTITWADGAGQDFFYGDQVPAPTCTAIDGGSGVNGGCTVTGFATDVGWHTLTATATDHVGNVATLTRTYQVKPWTLDGFYRPVDMNGVLNTVKAGSTVPLKFNVFKGADRMTSGIGATFAVRPMDCQSQAVTDAVEELTTTGSTSLRYDSTAQQWIQNWATPKSGAGSCYVTTMTTADGSSLSASFKLTK